MILLVIWKRCAWAFITKQWHLSLNGNAVAHHSALKKTLAFMYKFSLPRVKALLFRRPQRCRCAHHASSCSYFYQHNKRLSKMCVANMLRIRTWWTKMLHKFPPTVRHQTKQRQAHLVHTLLPFNFLVSDHIPWFGHGFISCLASDLLFCPIHEKIWEMFLVPSQKDNPRFSTTVTLLLKRLICL